MATFRSRGDIPVEVPTIQNDFASGRRVQACNQPERGCLAASGRPQEHEELPLGQAEVDPVHSDLCVKGPGQLSEFQEGLFHGQPLAPNRCSAFVPACVPVPDQEADIASEARQSPGLTGPRASCLRRNDGLCSRGIASGAFAPSQCPALGQEVPDTFFTTLSFPRRRESRGFRCLGIPAGACPCRQ